MNRHPIPSAERRVALCYIRLSQTKDTSDLKSPERQRANLLAACERYGWTPEWYEDADKHKSGTKEANRPVWMRLKTRLNDADVGALAVNDTSRAMRNTWRAIKLFEDLSSSDVKLYLASSDRLMDIKSPDGRLTLYMQAFMDEMYALDASRRALDSVRYRKARGISVGIPPFGTIRNADGYLMPQLRAHGGCRQAVGQRVTAAMNRRKLMRSGAGTTMPRGGCWNSMPKTKRARIASLKC